MAIPVPGRSGSCGGEEPLPVPRSPWAVRAVRVLSRRREPGTDLEFRGRVDGVTLARLELRGATRWLASFLDFWLIPPELAAIRPCERRVSMGFLRLECFRKRGPCLDRRGESSYHGVSGRQ